MNVDTEHHDGRRRRHTPWRPFILHPSALVLTLLVGCATPPGVPKVDPIHAPPEVATLDYWLAQPPSVVVQGTDYDKLWRACEAAVDDRLFALERRDYRDGVLTTRPLLGGQLLEFWRSDIADGYSMAESNIASVRRTVQFRIVPIDGGFFEVQPKVVVERHTLQERRVTLGMLNRNAFGGSAVVGVNDYDATVTTLPDYWFATRRDENLESRLADDIRKRLARAM